MIAALRNVVDTLTAKSHDNGFLTSSPGSAEHRTSPRHEVEIAGRVCLVGTEHLCTIRNVSTGGMTVSASAAAVCIGQQVIVETDHMGSLYGIVRWHRDGSFGVQFQTPMAPDLINHARQNLPAGMRSRPGRARIRMPACVYYGGNQRQVEVGNIAVGGLMMTTPEPLRPGQPVMVEFRDMLPIGGHVRWWEEGCCGVMFTKLLPIAAAETIAHRANLSEAWLAEVRAAHAQVG